jgi:PAS domain-containing protein
VNLTEQVTGSAPDGTIRHVQLNIKKLKLNEVDHHLFAITDITEYVSKQQQLDDSQELLRALFRNTSYGLVLVEKDTYFIAGVNDRALQFTEASFPDQVSGEDFYNTFNNLLPTLDRRNVNALMANQTMLTGEVTGTDSKGHLKHILFEINKINQANKIYYLFNLTDITDKKEKEQQTQHNRKLLKSIIDASPFQTYLVEGDKLKVVLMNTKAMKAFKIHHLEEAQLIDMTLFTNSIIDDNQREEWNQIILSRNIARIELQVKSRDLLSLHWVEAFVTPVEMEGREMILIKLHDITERNKIALELLKNQQMLTAIFNQSSDALLLRKFETMDGLICNQVALDMFDAATKEALASKDLSAYSASEWSAADDENLKKELLEKGIYEIDFHYITIKGRLFWGYTRLQWRTRRTRKTCST